MLSGGRVCRLKRRLTKTTATAMMMFFCRISCSGLQHAQIVSKSLKKSTTSTHKSIVNLGRAAVAVTVNQQQPLFAFQRPSQSLFLSAHYSSESTEVSEDRDSWKKLPRLFVGTSQVSRVAVGGCSFSDVFRDRNNGVEHESNNKLGQDATVVLSKDQSHYLSTVLRLKKKARSSPRVRLFNHGGDEWLAEIVTEANGGGGGHRSSSFLVAQCVEKLRSQLDEEEKEEESLPKYCWIFVAAPKKKDRSRWLVEKCTEMSAAGFVFLETEYSEIPEAKVSKLLTYTVEASEQSERLEIPRFVQLVPGGEKNTREEEEDDSPTTNLGTVLDAWEADPSRFPLLVCRERSVGAPSAVEVLQSIFLDRKPHVVTAFLIGPEGGWSPSEEHRFDAMENEFPKLFHNVALGPTVLRTETAAFAAVAAHSMIRMRRR